MVDQSLDGQFASAVDEDATSTRPILGEFHDDVFDGHEVQEAERAEKRICTGQEEAQAAQTQMAASEDRTRFSYTSASGSVGKPTLSAKQIGKLPAYPFRRRCSEINSGNDAGEWEAGTLKMHIGTQQRLGTRCPSTQEKMNREVTRSEADSSTGKQPQNLQPRPEHRCPSAAVQG